MTSEQKIVLSRTEARELVHILIDAMHDNEVKITLAPTRDAGVVRITVNGYTPSVTAEVERQAWDLDYPEEERSPIAWLIREYGGADPVFAARRNILPARATVTLDGGLELIVYASEVRSLDDINEPYKF